MAQPRATIRYTKGPFPQYIKANGVDLPVKIDAEKQTVEIGCTLFSLSVVENLLKQMKGEPV